MASAGKDAAALGFRSHSGWAVAVAVAGSPRKPVVLDRRRIVIASATLPGSKQPYHAAERLNFEQSQTLIDRCSKSSIGMATDAVTALIADVRGRGYGVVGTAIVTASSRVLPELSTILKSHALIHTAEGEFFRDALAAASEHCSLPVRKVREREVWEMAAAQFRLSGADLEKCVGDLGRSLGPPWRQDEKLACLAAWIALAEWETSIPE